MVVAKTLGRLNLEFGEAARSNSPGASDFSVLFGPGVSRVGISYSSGTDCTPESFRPNGVENELPSLDEALAIGVPSA